MQQKQAKLSRKSRPTPGDWHQLRTMLSQITPWPGELPLLLTPIIDRTSGEWIEYGPKAQIHWFKFPTACFDLQGRCRVDIYPDYLLVILTDVGRGGVQNNFENIVRMVCQRFGINARWMRLFLRYAFDLTLIHEVKFSSDFPGTSIYDPDWQDISTQQFEQIIDKAEAFSSRPATRL